MSHATVRIGVIGVGYWGPKILRNLSQLNGVDIIGVCDLSREALLKVKIQYPGLPLFSSFEEMIECARPDGVVIVTPAKTHSNLAAQAMENGIDVFVEKPLATTYDDALELVRISRHNKRILMVGHTFLYSEYVRTLKNIIGKGEIGSILHIFGQRLAWGQVRTDVDVLWNLGPHDISICNYLTGNLPVEGAAWGMNVLDPSSGRADIVVARLQYPGNITACLHFSWLNPQKIRQMVVAGSEKMIVYDDTDPVAPITVHEKCARKETGGKIISRDGTAHAIPVDLPEPLGVELSHFIACIQNRGQPVTDGLHGLEVISVLESLSSSMQSGGIPVKISMRGL